MATTPVVPVAPSAPAADPGQPVSHNLPAEPAAPQVPATPPSEWFLEAPTGTRYRTPDDAIRGIAEKDATIDRYKQQLAQAQQALTGQPQPQAAQQTAADVLEQALITNNRPLFDQALKQMMQAELQAALGQIQPLVSYAGLNQAVELASRGPNGDPNIANFLRSEGYQKVVSAFPLIGQAIESEAIGKEAVEQKAQVLRMAYSLAQQFAQPSAPAAPQTPVQRPPVSTTAPAQPVGSTGQMTRDDRNRLYDQFSSIFGAGQ